MPVFSYLCHSCMYEFDSIEGHDSPKSQDCPRCEEEGSARRIISASAAPRGNFGTTPRRGKDKTQEFKFNSDGQGEFDFTPENNE
jgi:putative FmdB family regulatory protein